MKTILLLSVALLLSSCSSLTYTPHSLNKFPPYSGKVLLTRGGIPPLTVYEVVGEIELGRFWYGRSPVLAVAMADRARSVGANAVINVETWVWDYQQLPDAGLVRDPTYSATPRNYYRVPKPAGRGLAIYIHDMEALNLRGEYR